MKMKNVGDNEDELRDYLFKKFLEAFDNYSGAWEIRAYLRHCLKKIYEQFDCYEIRKKKKDTKAIGAWLLNIHNRNYIERLDRSLDDIDFGLLTEKQEKIIRLKLADYSNRKIATIMNMSETAVRQIYFRTVKKLRKIYNNEGNNNND